MSEVEKKGKNSRKNRPPTKKELKELFKKYPPQFKQFEMEPKFKIGEKVVPKDWAECHDWEPRRNFIIKHLAFIDGEIIYLFYGSHYYRGEKRLFISTEKDLTTITEAKKIFFAVDIKRTRQEIKQMRQQRKGLARQIKKGESRIQRSQKKLANLKRKK